MRSSGESFPQGRSGRRDAGQTLLKIDCVEIAPIAAALPSTASAVPAGRQATRQSRKTLDCRSATIKTFHHATIDNQKSTPKKILAKHDSQHDHAFATGRRFTLRLPPAFSRLALHCD
jgi:hypothetical protein